MLLISLFKSFWLKICSKIKALFGKRKMEINETIDKWFNETNKLIQNEIEDLNSIDGLCQAALNSSNDFCCSIILLLRSGHIMPAKALLRCLCELLIKLCWCLSVSDNISDAKDDHIVKAKIQRWEKDTLCNNIKILEKFSDVVDEITSKKFKKEIAKLKQEPLFSNGKIKRLPALKDIAGQLPEIFKNEVYPRFYIKFNNAIHLDVTSLVDTYKTKNKKISKNVFNDLIEDCMTLALQINAVIRMNYEIDISSIKQEFHNIIKDLYETNAHANL
ncbi:MAG: DUF5677 domain-containing protein [Sedimentisphaerales bacterium]